MSTPGLLFGMGNPLLDIVAVVDKAFLDRYGLKENDAILADDKHMGIYDEVKSMSPLFIPGGATQNAINITQWILGTPGSTLMTGCIRDDEFGKILTKACQKNGVTTIYNYHSEAPTGVCAVLVNGHNRSLVTSLGAASKFDPNHLDDPSIWNHVLGAKFFYSASFFLTSSVPALMKIAHHVADNASTKTLLLNLSAPFLCQFFHAPMMEVMPYVSILFGNESEAQTFAENHGWEGKTVAEIAKCLSNLPLAPELQLVNKKRLVIITQGSDPVLSIMTGEENVCEWPVEKIPDDDIADTNGAGDAFVGGFISQYIQGHSLAKCIDCGIWASKKIIQQTGCSIPKDCHYK